jgi:filamentous hemagglutinin
MNDNWINYSVDRLRRSNDPSLMRTADIIEKAEREGNLVRVVSGVNSDGMVLVKPSWGGK